MNETNILYTYIIYVMLIVCDNSDKAALTCTYLCWIALGLFCSHVGVISAYT